MELKGDLLFLRVSHRVYQASVQWMRDTLESLIVNLLRQTVQEWKAEHDGEGPGCECVLRAEGPSQTLKDKVSGRRDQTFWVDEITWENLQRKGI